jgi:DNA-binding transcriptional MerR regulator
MKRKISAWKVVAVAAAIAAVCVASIAIAQPSSDDKSNSNRANSGPNGEGPGRPLQALAKKLGVSTADLRKALQSSRQDAGGPSDQVQQIMEKHCTEVTDAVGKALNKSGDDVRAAFKAAAKAHLDKAVKNGRLSQSQADAIQKRLDSSACIPPGPGPMVMFKGRLPGHRPHQGAEKGTFKMHFREGDRPKPLEDAAKQLGVSTADLRKALEAAHKEVGPPSTQERQQLQQSFEQHCTTVTDALGKALGKSGDDVRSAIKAVAKDRVEYAVDHGRLTRSQADEIEKRIDSSSCVPPGPGGFNGRGPGVRHFGPGPGPGGPDGPGGPGSPDGPGRGAGFEVPAPPPGAPGEAPPA